MLQIKTSAATKLQGCKLVNFLPRARASGLNGSVSLSWLKPTNSMKIDPDFQCNFKARFFPQKSLQGFNFLPKASQSDPKIDEKSNPTGFPILWRNLDFWWQYNGFAWFFRSRRALKLWKFDEKIDPAKIRPRIAPKSSPRSIFPENL